MKEAKTVFFTLIWKSGVRGVRPHGLSLFTCPIAWFGLAWLPVVCEKLHLALLVIFSGYQGQIQKIQKEWAESPTPPPPLPPQMKTSLFRRCCIQHYGRICDAKLSHVSVSEDRIKEHFIKRFSKKNCKTF